MSEQSHDRPDVAVFPPVIPLAALALACGLQWLIPLGLIFAFSIIWRIGAGTIAVIAGALITIKGGFTLTASGTNVNPLGPTTVLETAGIYSWTRNPTYVGLAPVMCGIALIFALDWLLLLVVPSYLILNFCVIKCEEQYLERKFGEEYRRYKARVPRYVPLFARRAPLQSKSDSHQEI